MRLAACIHFWSRFLCALLLAACLLSAPGFDASAQANIPPVFKIKLYDTGLREMCVGETTTITGSFWPNPDSMYPLAGPDMQLWAARGSTNPRRMVPGTTSGIFHFTYKAERAGEDEIHADIVRYDGSTGAAAALKIKVVEKCAYQFELNVEMYARPSAGDDFEKVKYTMKVKSNLKPGDPAQPNKLESHPSIKITTTMLDYKLGDCVMLSSEVGNGVGFVDVYGELVDDGKQIHVWLSPPYQLTWDVNASAVCTGIPVNYNKMLPLSSDQDPWIETTMQASGGQRGVLIDLFAKGVQNFRNAGHPAYYYATVKVTKKGSK